MVFKQGADLFDLQPIHVVAPHHRVGVAHGHAGHHPLFSAYRHRLTDDRVAHAHHRDGVRLYRGSTHVHLDPGDHAILHRQIQVLHPALGLYGDGGLVGQALVIAELGHAADAVAAHGALTAIGVVHGHAEIRLVGGADEDEPIGANAKVPVAELQRHAVWVWQGLLGTVHIDIVIAAAVHFCKFHGHCSFRVNACAEYTTYYNIIPPVVKRGLSRFLRCATFSLAVFHRIFYNKRTRRNNGR